MAPGGAPWREMAENPDSVRTAVDMHIRLRFDIGATDLDGIELIAADTPIENFLRACFGVEVPAGPLFD